MPELDSRTRQLLVRLGAEVRSARVALGWSQRRLAAASACSQSVVSRIERAAMPSLTLRTATRVARALGIALEVILVRPRIDRPAIQDRAHARCVATVAGKLRRAGFLVATEVAVGRDRWRGFIDVLAMHPEQRLLVVCEVKTEIGDIGAADRQLGTYVDEAWEAARERGWGPRGVTGILVLLATDDVDRALREHRKYFDEAFPLRARDLATLVDGSRVVLQRRGARGLAMIDPASRRRAWLMPTSIDGRRSPARYPDRLAFLAPRRATPPQAAPPRATR